MQYLCCACLLRCSARWKVPFRLWLLHWRTWSLLRDALQVPKKGWCVALLHQQKSSKAPSARWPKLKMPHSVSKTRHLWRITTTGHSKSPKSGPLGSRLFEALWGWCSCHQTNPRFVARFPRFGNFVGEIFAHEKLNKKKTQAKHWGTFHPSCFQVQVSFHPLHWFVTFGFVVEEDQSDQFLDQLWLSSPSHPSPSPSSPADSSHVDASQSSRASFFVMMRWSLWKACTSKLDTHSNRKLWFVSSLLKDIF